MLQTKNESSERDEKGYQRMSIRPIFIIIFKFSISMFWERDATSLAYSVVGSYLLQFLGL